MNLLRAVVFGGRLVVAFTGASAADFDQFLDSKITKMEAGQLLTQDEKNESSRQFSAFRAELEKKCGTNLLLDWSHEDQARHYVKAVKMAIIDTERQGGWPSRHAGMTNVYPYIKDWLEKDKDPYLMVALIIPALNHQDAQCAITIYNELAIIRPFLANFILVYVRKYYYSGVTSEKFLAAVVTPVGLKFHGRVVKPGNEPEKATNIPNKAMNR